MTRTDTLAFLAGVCITLAVVSFFNPAPFPSPNFRPPVARVVCHVPDSYTLLDVPGHGVHAVKNKGWAIEYLNPGARVYVAPILYKGTPDGFQILKGDPGQ